MSQNTGLNFESIDFPYDENLDRIVTMNSNSIETTDYTSKELSGKDFNDLWISSWIKSRNYKPKKRGFLIDGKLGYIECMKLYVGSGGIVGGKLDIPNTLADESFHTNSTGNSWWGCNVADFTTSIENADAYILKDGTAKFKNAIISGGSSVSFISNTLNTSAKTILGEFTFSGSGAIAIKTDANNGLWLSPTGILGKKAGANTFTLTADGTATFAGTLAAASGTFGAITAGDMTGLTITGGIIRTSLSGERIELNHSGLENTITSWQDDVNGNYFQVYGRSLSWADDAGLIGDIVSFNTGPYITFRIWNSGRTAMTQCDLSYNDWKMGLDILPRINNAYDLGTSSYKWRNLYISASVITPDVVPAITNAGNCGTSSKVWGNAEFKYLNIHGTGGATSAQLGGDGATLTVNKNFAPSTDNARLLGTASNRWSDVKSVLINGADYGFDNDWWITESYKIDIEEDGLAVLNTKNEMVLFIGKTGLYVKNGNTKNLKDIKYAKRSVKKRIPIENPKKKTVKRNK